MKIGTIYSVIRSPLHLPFDKLTKLHLQNLSLQGIFGSHEVLSWLFSRATVGSCDGGRRMGIVHSVLATAPPSWVIWQDQICQIPFLESSILRVSSSYAESQTHPLLMLASLPSFKGNSFTRTRWIPTAPLVHPQYSGWLLTICINRCKIPQSVHMLPAPKPTARIPVLPTKEVKSFPKTEAACSLNPLLCQLCLERGARAALPAPTLPAAWHSAPVAPSFSSISHLFIFQH